MDCPKCGLVNPATARRCDCGYDFMSKTAQAPYVIKTEHKLCGIDGWLALFCMGAIVDGPLQALNHLGNRPLRVIIIDIALTLFGFFTGAALYGRRPYALKVTKVFLIAMAALGILGGTLHFAAKAVTVGGLPTVADLTPLGPALFAAIWLAYFKKSERVRVTFGRNI